MKIKHVKQGIPCAGLDSWEMPGVDWSQHTLLLEVTNHAGQELEFYEDPILGDCTTILVRLGDHVADTEMFDTGDFYKESDYLPVYVEEENKFYCRFEIEEEL